MKHPAWIIVALFWALVILGMGSQAITASDEIMVLGTVTEDLQLETEEGDRYLISDNAQGDELAKFVGKRVEVIGRIMFFDDHTLIKVSQFTVLGNTSK